MVTSLATRFCVRLLSLCSQFRGGGFEGTVEITGLLSYKPDQPWPFAADVDRIRVLPRKPEVSLRSTGRCTLFVAVGTSGVVEPAANFVAHVAGRARTIYVGPEEPANASSFTESYLGKAGEVLPDLFGSFV